MLLLLVCLWLRLQVDMSESGLREHRQGVHDHALCLTTAVRSRQLHRDPQAHEVIVHLGRAAVAPEAQRGHPGTTHVCREGGFPRVVVPAQVVLGSIVRLRLGIIFEASDPRVIFEATQDLPAGLLPVCAGGVISHPM